jgi:tellurite resistance protein TehA-like permease
MLVYLRRFGLWWLLHGVYAVVMRHAAGTLKFNMGWWGFVFPLGVFASATIILASELRSTFMACLAMLFIIALAIILLVVSYSTVAGAYHGTIFAAPLVSALSTFGHSHHATSEDRIEAVDVREKYAIV